MWKETTWGQTLEREGGPVLELSMALPEPEGMGPGVVRMARYYHRLGELWRARWMDSLYNRACAGLEEARVSSRPFQPWRAELSHQVTWTGEDLTSLYVDVTERRGEGRPMTVRSAGTWRRSGTPVALPEFFRERRGWRRWALEEVQRQIRRQLERGESLLFPDAEARAALHFSPRRFYLTGDGVVLFYPMCALGAPVEGIPTFLLPKERESPPEKT